MVISYRRSQVAAHLHVKRLWAPAPAPGLCCPTSTGCLFPACCPAGGAELCDTHPFKLRVLNEPAREKKVDEKQREHSSKQTGGGGPGGGGGVGGWAESPQEGINPFRTQGMVPAHSLTPEKGPDGRECGDGAGRRQTSLWKSNPLVLNSGDSAQP